MKKIFTVLALSTSLVQPSLAWDTAELNKTVEQTNFIVERGCSGTLIDKEKRLILTNYHCIDDKVTFVERDVLQPDGSLKKVKFRKYEDVTVAQKKYDGFSQTGQLSFVAEIVAEAKTRDLAVLKVKGELPNTLASPLRPENKKVVRGDKVYIVGNPLGEDASLVVGYVSSVNRAFDFPWTDGARLPMIQMSGGLAGGNSGGALYNNDGELIGVPAAGYPMANHIGFAIPMEVIRPFLDSNCLMTADDDACRAKKKAEAEKNKKKDD